MQRLHQAEFILRAGTRKDIEFLRGFAELNIVHHLQLSAGNGVFRIANPQHLADTHRGLRMVAGDHLHADPRLQAVADGRNRLRPRRIHHPGNPEQNDALLQILMGEFRLTVGGGFPRCRHHPQPFPRILFDFAFPVRLVERLQAMVGLLMLAQAEQDIGRAGNQNHLFIADAVQRRHIFIL